MPPEERVVPRFVAEPPQEALPYGRWAQRLAAEFLQACLGLGEGDEQLGEPGEITWYPDRGWHGRVYVPASTITDRGYELFGYVRYVPGAEDDDPDEFFGWADYTDETAERNRDWTLDLCEETIGSWRGHLGAVAAMTLVWGRPLVGGGRVATAELAGLAVDQCELLDGRFSLVAPDDYRGDLLEIALYGGRGQELARESLYADSPEGDGQEEEEEEEEDPDDDDVSSGDTERAKASAEDDQESPGADASERDEDGE
jgi:hypothetical protein